MKRAFLAVFVLCIVAACGGGGGGGGSSSIPVGKQPTSQTGKAAITIVVPNSAKSSSALRTPKYIVPGTQSVAIQVISVDGVTPNPPLAPTIAQIGPNAPGCTTISTGVSCTVNVNVPYATSLILQISSFASTDGSGTALAVGTLGPIDSTQPNPTPFPVALGGNVASIQASPGAFSPVVDGSSQQITFTVSAFDSSGNLILPPGNYPTPITFAVGSDPNSAISFSPSSITAPPTNGITTVTMTFNSAKTIGATSIVASAGAGVTSSINFTPLGSGGGTLTAGYHIIEVPIPTNNSGPWGITGGPGGSLWFTETNTDKIAELTSPSQCSGAANCKIIEESFPFPTQPSGLAFGNDGNLLVGGLNSNSPNTHIWQVQTAGSNCASGTQSTITCTTVNIPDPINTPAVYDMRMQQGGLSGLIAVASQSGSGGNMSFYQPTIAQWYSTTTAGSWGNGPFGVSSNGFSTIPSLDEVVQSSCTDGCNSNDLAFVAGGNPQGILYHLSDGLDYVADPGTNAIVSFYGPGCASTCTYTSVSIPTLSSTPEFLVTGADGNVWFTEFTGNKIGVLTMTGHIYEIPVPTANAGPWGITLGSDGNIWFTELNTGKIGVVVP